MQSWIWVVQYNGHSSSVASTQALPVPGSEYVAAWLDVRRVGHMLCHAIHMLLWSRQHHTIILNTHVTRADTFTPTNTTQHHPLFAAHRLRRRASAVTAPTATALTFPRLVSVSPPLLARLSMPPYTFVSVQDDGTEPAQYSFRHCLLTGYADDGGMLMPAAIPHLEAADCHSLTYEQLVGRVLSLFVSPAEVDSSELSSLLHRSYARFSPFDATQPERELRLTPFTVAGSRLELLELTCGPTLTFKDTALQPLAALIAHMSHEPLHVLVGTSGDTGSAAIEAVLPLPNASITVLYPHQRIGRLQQLQMTTVRADSVRVVAVDGSSDELDVPIKAVLDDGPFSRRHSVTSINSINVGRILLQMAHFFWAALRNTAADTPTAASTAAVPPVSFALPTGAMGHFIAALLAVRVGLPVRRIIVATNSNDCVSRLVTSGVYRPSSAVSVTSSNAMDISQPYNVERLVWLLAAGDQQSKAKRVKQCMRQVRDEGEFELSSGERAELARMGVVALSVDEQRVSATIRQVWQESSVLVDPHTAVGIAAAGHFAPLDRTADERIVCVSTAHPAKFIERVAAATGLSETAVVSHLQRSCPSSANVERAIQLHSQPIHREFSLRWDRQHKWETELRRLIEERTLAIEHNTSTQPPLVDPGTAA